MTDYSPDVPFQVTTLIDSLRNKKEKEHVRMNYRTRLLNIRSTIDQAIREHDIEIANKQFGSRKGRK